MMIISGGASAFAAGPIRDVRQNTFFDGIIDHCVTGRDFAISFSGRIWTYFPVLPFLFVEVGAVAVFRSFVTSAFGTLIRASKRFVLVVVKFI